MVVVLDPFQSLKVIRCEVGDKWHLINQNERPYKLINILKIVLRWHVVKLVVIYSGEKHLNLFVFHSFMLLLNESLLSGVIMHVS